MPHKQFTLYLDGLDQIDANEALNVFRGASLIMNGEGVQDLAEQAGYPSNKPEISGDLTPFEVGRIKLMQYQAS